MHGIKNMSELPTNDKPSSKEILIATIIILIIIITNTIRNLRKSQDMRKKILHTVTGM